jgi:hypothetical protein
MRGVWNKNLWTVCQLIFLKKYELRKFIAPLPLISHEQPDKYRVRKPLAGASLCASFRCAQPQLCVGDPAVGFR